MVNVHNMKGWDNMKKENANKQPGNKKESKELKEIKKQLTNAFKVKF